MEAVPGSLIKSKEIDLAPPQLLELAMAFGIDRAFDLNTRNSQHFCDYMFDKAPDALILTPFMRQLHAEREEKLIQQLKVDLCTAYWDQKPTHVLESAFLTRLFDERVHSTLQLQPPSQEERVQSPEPQQRASPQGQQVKMRKPAGVPAIYSAELADPIRPEEPPVPKLHFAMPATTPPRSPQTASSSAEKAAQSFCQWKDNGSFVGSGWGQEVYEFLEDLDRGSLVFFSVLDIRADPSGVPASAENVISGDGATPDFARGSALRSCMCCAAADRRGSAQSKGPESRLRKVFEEGFMQVLVYSFQISETKLVQNALYFDFSQKISDLLQTLRKNRAGTPGVPKSQVSQPPTDLFLTLRCDGPGPVVSYKVSTRMPDSASIVRSKGMLRLRPADLMDHLRAAESECQRPGVKDSSMLEDFYNSIFNSVLGTKGIGEGWCTPRVNEAFLSMCARCGQLAQTRCSRCHDAAYCSLQCQNFHWIHHEPFCSDRYGV
eukprot:gnl/TRDRNA2_/TRDRNA2_161591_c0_seq1.p1 gnl/TRDRNA2_/TRDRNA2_161591_c0~~gnl/TRDRNA2_/TRDRNA2_161591_c0_seq1.p1  ORF type:complete len:572 (+),score=87.80 gnl/TRDRNA2_/TRDRNA2_161591_c0_seq1:243-1718(+)